MVDETYSFLSFEIGSSATVDVLLDLMTNSHKDSMSGARKYL